MSKTEKITEEELIRLLRSRDKHGFVVLYDNYSAALYGIVLKIVRSEEIAEDILQEAFIKVWKNIESYSTVKGTLFTWLLNIARNTAIDKIRSQSYKQSSQIQSLENNVRLLDAQNSTQQSVEHIGLQKVVDKLKPEHQLVIDLIYFKGYTQAEVADELKIPLGTVKTRVRLALTHLRSLII